MRIIQPDEFSALLYDLLTDYAKPARAVTGPGRSGAIAAVYASHFLSIPYIPYGLPCSLSPLLIVDTAVMSGRTLRRACRKYVSHSKIVLAPFFEPPRVKFWYEFNTHSPASQSYHLMLHPDVSAP